MPSEDSSADRRGQGLTIFQNTAEKENWRTPVDFLSASSTLAGQMALGAVTATAEFWRRSAGALTFGARREHGLVANAEEQQLGDTRCVNLRAPPRGFLTVGVLCTLCGVVFFFSLQNALIKAENES